MTVQVSNGFILNYNAVVLENRSLHQQIEAVLTSVNRTLIATEEILKTSTSQKVHDRFINGLHEIILILETKPETKQ